MNPFDDLMDALIARNVVAFVRNCNMASPHGIPAAFKWGYDAALSYTEHPAASARKTVEAHGATSTAALKAAINATGIMAVAGSKVIDVTDETRWVVLHGRDVTPCVVVGTPRELMRTVKLLDGSEHGFDVLESEIWNDRKTAFLSTLQQGIDS